MSSRPIRKINYDTGRELTFEEYLDQLEKKGETRALRWLKEEDAKIQKAKKKLLEI